MTGYTVHTGASKKFVSGWDRVFGDDTNKSASKAKSSGKKTKGKSAAKGKKAKKK
jgi:hypothetical protein